MEIRYSKISELQRPEQYYNNFCQRTFCWENETEICGINSTLRFDTIFKIFLNNWIQLDLFDDKRIICDIEEAIFESKDGKKWLHVFFISDFRIQKFNAIYM